MNKNSDKATIREVYNLIMRLEEKIDKIDNRVSAIEGKTSILAVFWSSIISIVGIVIGIMMRR